MNVAYEGESRSDGGAHAESDASAASLPRYFAGARTHEPSLVRDSRSACPWDLVELIETAELVQSHLTARIIDAHPRGAAPGIANRARVSSFMSLTP